MACRAGASTEFTTASTGTRICSMYEFEYFIITCVWLQERVVVDEYEYQYENQSVT